MKGDILKPTEQDVPTIIPAASERRSYVRIKDKLSLCYKYIDAGDEGFACETNTNLRNSELLEINNHLDPLLMRLQDRPSGLGKALALVNRKLNLVLESMHALEPLEEGMKTICTKVSLSASGMSFYCDSAPPDEKKTSVKLILQLEPSGTRFHCLAKVVRCETSTRHGMGFKLAVFFTDFTDKEQELLIQHVVRRQAVLFRAEKNNQQVLAEKE